MAYVIAQISDVHIGGRVDDAGERFSEAVDAINSMGRQPDLVLVTGDMTESGSAEQWDEFLSRLSPLRAPWDVVRGNHDRAVDAYVGHRSIELGDLKVVLLDTSSDEFTDDDAQWLDAHLSTEPDRPTVIAIHQPPFETGIWWMDCVGLRGGDRFEAVVRRHPQVRHVMSGHVHRPITTAWAGCLLTVCPSSAVLVAGDLDPSHDPSETAEPPMIALHAYLGDTVVSHTMAVGAAGELASISERAPEFVAWARGVQSTRRSDFGPAPAWPA